MTTPDRPERTRAPRRGSRVWLFTPFVLLGLLVVAWSIAWFVIRERVASELDARLAAQVSQGRTWTCADRRIGGFPFRIEISCARLALETDDGLFLDLGPARALAQVYQPRHVIVEVDGPLAARTPEGTLDVEWTLLEASVRNLGRGTEQLAVVVADPRARVAAAGLPTPLAAQAARAELYVRPSPGATRLEGPIDAVLRAVALEAPGVGDVLPAAAAVAAPTDVEAQLR
ncbi:DUF2125 domain-containing protein, partial [Salinarimonas sp. NSM]|uniref:DUF2125 domain-containing protein n=1 Tax=Salinarimonas sp. NSM TaxID=3458003 RepID=UPI00403620BD